MSSPDSPPHEARSRWGLIRDVLVFQLKLAIDALGEDYFVFSTDYPHADSKYPESADRFLKLPLSESAQRRIMWDNCARLYGLD